MFPFLYRGVLHDSCIVRNGTAPWCSLTRDYDADDLRGDCIFHAVKPTPQGISGLCCVVVRVCVVHPEDVLTLSHPQVLRQHPLQRLKMSA